MKQLLIFMRIISGLFSFFGCNNQKETKIIATDSSGNVQTINPNELLMTIPTIENTFPDFENKSDTNNLKILEDDWRQIEFVSKDQKHLIDQEIDSITYIFEHEMHQGKDYSTFKNLYVRRLITKPVSLTFEKVQLYLGDAKNKLAGININGNVGQVKNGFSISSQGFNYYGIKDENNVVSVLCFYIADTDVGSEISVDKISKFLKAENLYIVDWVHRQIADEKNVKDFFSY
ncbi:MAG: hypothetical protein J0H29_21860 [Sphingobacteriales bacterium]|nr:hypothetical protein [Sphingobacteriales bacterium]OJY85069.1 MAG: hypothetical protein BGP14_04285 [Sphingobacteriales bacterium 44-15]